MTDLINRLRERAKVAREENTGTALGDALHFEEAADEIDRLLTVKIRALAIADERSKELCALRQLLRSRDAVGSGKET